MKIFGLNSKVNINGQVFSVASISKRGVALTNGKSLKSFTLTEVEENIINKVWMIQ